MSPWLKEKQKISLKGLKPYEYIPNEPKIEIKRNRKAFGRTLRHEMNPEENLNYCKYIRSTGF